MSTIAELEIKVDSTQTERGTKALLALAEAADKAAAARKRFNDTAAGGGGGPGGGGPDDAATKKAKSLSEAIDTQAKKLADLARQRKTLNDSPLKTENPEEYKRLNAVIDARTELVRRQGNSLDALAAKAKKEQEQREAASRASQAAADKEKRALEQREAAAARFAEAEQKRLSITISSLSRQVKAQEDYNRTVATLNNARAVGGMSGGSGGISAAQYDTYVKQAAAIRDAALAQADNTKEIERAQRAYDASVASLGRVERAEATYAKNLRDSDAALKLNLITQEQYTRQLAAFAAKRDASISQANSTAAAENQFAQSLRNVLTTYDPVLRATDSYNASIKILSQGFQQGAIDATTFNRALTEQRSALDAVKNAQPGSAEAQAKQYQAALDRLLPYNSQLRSLAESERVLQQAQSTGRVVTEQQIKDYNRATQAIAAERKEIERRTQSENRGNSAKQNAAAIRGLPAQATDVVVSLQGGQNPLTVLLQQGGQVKDMFGGVGNAIKATGTYLLTLVNPLSVTAAGFTALAYGLYAGTRETVAFNKAIIQSGGFSGTSASGLSAYRNELDSIAGTASKAAQTLTAIQASGKITDSLFLAIAESAIKLERATGESVEKIVDDFASLAKDPVNAAITLDEKYKFLTASILATADSLVKQGRQQEAVIFLQKEMSAAATTTAENLVDRAGTIEKAWRGVKDILAETLDALKSIGREDTTQDQITILEERKSELERSIATNNTRGGGLVQKEKIAALAATEKELVQLRTRKQYEDYTAAFNAEQEQARKRGVEIQRQNSSAYEANIGVIDRVAAAEISLAQVRKRGQEIVAGARVRNETLSEDVIRQQQAAENAAQKRLDLAIEAKKNAAKGKSSPVDNTQVQEVKNNLDSIKSEYSNYYKEVTALGEDNIVSRAATYASQKAVLEAEAKAVDDSYEQQIAAIKRLQGVKSNSAQANISLTNQLNKAESDRAKAAEANDSKQKVLAAKEKGRIDARTASIEAYNDALRQQIENTAVSGERQAAAVGKGDRQGGVDDALAENDRSFAKDQAKLAKSLSNGMDPEEYATNLKNLTDAHTAMADQIVANDARIQEANADWTNGFTKAIQNAADQGNNFADSVNRAVSGAFDSMGDALGTFVTTGKINFSDLARSIIADMAKIAARQAASSALSSLFGAAASVAGSFFGGSTVTSTSGFSDYGTVTTQAKGGGWNGGTQFFAQGGAFTNSIVSSPTAFGMSGGNRGVMGEAGPEAIVPLARTSDGSLGVRMIGGANNQGTSSAGVNVYVNVSSEGAETSTDSSDPAYNMFGKELGDFVQSKYYTLQQKDLKDGGSLSVAIKR